ncbi:MAG: AAA family ATPase, partial [Pseudomonadota bacterium]
MERLPSIARIASLAAAEAVASQYKEIEPEHLLIAVFRFSELDRSPDPKSKRQRQFVDLLDLKTALMDMKLDATGLRRRLRQDMGMGGTPHLGGTIHRSRETKEIFTVAAAIASDEKAPYLTVLHLLKALLKEPTPRIARIVLDRRPGGNNKDSTTLDLVLDPDHDFLVQVPESPKTVLAPGTIVYEVPEEISKLAGLTETLTKLRTDLRAKVFGQDHAIHAFIEGLFNSEVVAAADPDRRRPKGLFVFAGPPGVGKTFLAETAAEMLARPFKRFDMSGFSDHQVAITTLAGIHKSYKDAHEGLLTAFVHENPNAILLFDEIEKAHLNVIHLFLQILDAGRLQDAFTEEDVQFRDTIIIFTTNAGKSLYDNTNSTGVYAGNSGFHRKTILDALENETDSRTGSPFFPPAICSRMAAGYPLMFNHLGVNELERVAADEFNRMAGLVQKQYGKRLECDPQVPLCMVLREGTLTDARTVRSQVEAFVKAELFGFMRLFEPKRLEQVLCKTDCIRIALDRVESFPEETRKLVICTEKPRVLLVADDDLRRLWSENVTCVDWIAADDEPEVLNIVQNQDVDMALVDLLIGPGPDPDPDFETTLASKEGTIYQFDQVPFAAKGIARGQEILRGIHETRPELPCFLISFGENGSGRPSLGDDLLMSCLRSGGARGVVETDFCTGTAQGCEQACTDLTSRIDDIARRIYLEKQARDLGSERKHLLFDTAPAIDKDGTIRIRLRNLRLSRALAASDVSEVLQDVERPTVRFADVYGAAAAKMELQFVVDWLKDPRRFKAMGLRPPRGILLYGHPGTGKTMLARALAGECNAAFVVASAANFVTMWQGSGPQNIRDLFARGRKYAPSIVFIDEIDAVGKKRTGGSGGGAGSTEQTLNALLTEMDGFGTPAAKPVIVLAATNLVEHLDEALRRRFDREVEVDRPDRAARAAYLKRRLQGTEHRCVSDPVIDRLAGQSASMTIAELERIIELAGRTASSTGVPITDEIVEEAFERMRMGETRSVPDKSSLLRTARHEAGHCLIGWLRGDKPVQVTIVARGNAGGFVEREADEERTRYVRPEMEGMIRQALAGRAAEMVYYGDDEGLSSGASADLQTATHWADLMIRDFGMSAGFGHIYIDSRRIGDG